MTNRPAGQIIWSVTRLFGFLLGITAVTLVAVGGHRAQTYGPFPKVLPICIVVLSILVNFIDFCVSANRLRPVTLNPALGWLADLVPAILLVAYTVTILRYGASDVFHDRGWNGQPIQIDHIDLLMMGGKLTAVLAGIHLLVGGVDLAAMCGVKPYHIPEESQPMSARPPNGVNDGRREQQRGVELHNGGARANP